MRVCSVYCDASVSCSFQLEFKVVEQSQPGFPLVAHADAKPFGIVQAQRAGYGPADIGIQLRCKFLHKTVHAESKLLVRRHVPVQLQQQAVGAAVLVEFETIYPGWYPGRTVHIHFKAYTDEETFVTSQMYFPDDVSDTVFLAEAYAARGPRRVTNANDGLLDGVSDDGALMGVVTQDGDGYVVALTIGVAR